MENSSGAPPKGPSPIRGTILSAWQIPVQNGDRGGPHEKHSRVVGHSEAMCTDPYWEPFSIVL